jgi:hypothetical protein
MVSPEASPLSTQVLIILRSLAVFFDSLIFCAAFLVVGHGDTSSRQPPRPPSGASVSVSVLSSGTGLAARAPE